VAVFFIPGVGSEHVEDKYAEFARAVRRPVPPVQERIQSITFTVDGEEWTATVGEQLRGVRTTRRRGQTRNVTTPLSDSATVLAIFAGDPHWMCTDAQQGTLTPTAWENPFMAPPPHEVVRFETRA
jgi:hypothetical protein